MACYTFYLSLFFFIIPLAHIIDWSALPQILKIQVVAIFVDITVFFIAKYVKNLCDCAGLTLGIYDFNIAKHK